MSRPKFVFASPYAAKLASGVCKNLKFVERVILIGDKKFDNETILLEDFIKKFEKKNFDVEANVSRKVDIKNQVAFIASSSGTTGMPKGVLVTQKNIMFMVQTYREKDFVTNAGVGIAPWFHALGFMGIVINACSRGFTYVFLTKFEGEAFLKCIQDYKAVVIGVVPPIMVFLAKSPLLDKYDLSSIEGLSELYW